MKTTLIKKYLVLAAALILAAGAVYAGGVWNSPTAAAPGTNMAVPVHTGTDQVKQIGTSTTTAGGLSVDSFVANGDALFDQQTFFQAPINGGTPASAAGSTTVTFGGAANDVDIQATGPVSASTYIKSKSVANPNSSFLCATTTGTIIICP